MPQETCVIVEHNGEWVRHSGDDFETYRSLEDAVEAADAPVR